MTMERAKMELNPPKDKYKLVFFILMLHGIGTLMPWNMFITAKSVIIILIFSNEDCNLKLIFFYFLLVFR